MKKDFIATILDLKNLSLTSTGNVVFFIDCVTLKHFFEKKDATTRLIQGIMLL